MAGAEVVPNSRLKPMFPRDRKFEDPIHSMLRKTLDLMRERRRVKFGKGYDSTLVRICSLGDDEKTIPFKLGVNLGPGEGTLKLTLEQKKQADRIIDSADLTERGREALRKMIIVE